MILTGLSMSPSFNSIAPWLLDLFGGRQTARTIHFVTMVALIGFFVVHMLMILAAGPINELRSIITGWYRIDPEREAKMYNRRGLLLGAAALGLSGCKVLDGANAKDWRFTQCL